MKTYLIILCKVKGAGAYPIMHWVRADQSLVNKKIQQARIYLYFGKKKNKGQYQSYVWVLSKEMGHI